MTFFKAIKKSKRSEVLPASAPLKTQCGQKEHVCIKQQFRGLLIIYSIIFIAWTIGFCSVPYPALGINDPNLRARTCGGTFQKLQ